MRILSIDLDFLTENLEKKENDLVFKDPFKINIIQKLLEKQNKENIVYLNTHGEIVNYVNEPSTIYNFDHHHDVYYEETVKNIVKSEVKRQNELTKKDLEELESCWVYYLYKKGLIENYYWFMNEDSEIQKDVLKFGFKFFLNYYSQYDPYRINLYNTTFDKVFIIKSPDYTTKEKLELIYPLIGIEGEKLDF